MFRRLKLLPSMPAHKVEQKVKNSRGNMASQKFSLTMMSCCGKTSTLFTLATSTAFTMNTA